jgi:hypothetical protein
MGRSHEVFAGRQTLIDTYECNLGRALLNATQSRKKAPDFSRAPSLARALAKNDPLVLA